MKMYSKEGVEMMAIYSLERKGTDLLIKGKMLRSMPSTIYIKPEEILKGLKLLSWSVALGLPIILFKAIWLSLTSKTKG